MESDRGLELYNSIFQFSLKVKKIHHHSRFTDKGHSIAERVFRTIKNLFRKASFFSSNCCWLPDLPSPIKKYNFTIHNSTKNTPAQAVKKVKEKDVFSNLQDKRQKETKNKLGQLVRTADFKKVFSKGGIKELGLQLIYSNCSHS